MAAPRPAPVRTQPSTEALIAHVLRRTTFGPFPGQVESLVGLGVDGVIDRVLAATPMSTKTKPPITDDGSYAPVDWWLDKMADPAAGLHEKMTWYWHGHLTTSHDKVFKWKIEFPQHLLIRANAMGKMNRHFSGPHGRKDVSERIREIGNRQTGARMPHDGADENLYVDE
jgi:hypothetical protein